MTAGRRILILITLLLFSCGGQKEYLPGSFFGLELSKKLTGQEALEFVNKLHFQKVTDEENIIGFYRGTKGRAMIYVTLYDDVLNAKLNFEKMTRKISPENSVFYDGGFFNLNKTEIYKCYGMGQKHFVFYEDTDLFWISTETEWGDEFLSEYLSYTN